MDVLIWHCFSYSSVKYSYRYATLILTKVWARLCTCYNSQGEGTDISIPQLANISQLKVSHNTVYKNFDAIFLLIVGVVVKA